MWQRKAGGFGGEGSKAVPREIRSKSGIGYLCEVSRIGSSVRDGEFGENSSSGSRREIDIRGSIRYSRETGIIDSSGGKLVFG